MQLGVPKGKVLFTLTKSKTLSEAAADCGGWSQIIPGQHHTVALDAAGRVHALGRVEYGRLGLGKQRETDATEPVQVIYISNFVYNYIVSSSHLHRALKLAKFYKSNNQMLV